MTSVRRALEVLRASRPKPQRWQVHIISGEQLQVAQIELPPHSQGFEVLAWASEMVGQCALPEPRRWNLYRDNEARFIPCSDAPTSFGPTFLTSR